MSTTIHRSHDDQRFKTVAPGVELCVLRPHGDAATPSIPPAFAKGTTALFRMAKGAHAPRHGHPGGEETYLVSGRLRVGDRVLAPGDYLWTAPGESHDGVAEEESVFFVVLPGGFEVDAAT